ncbi:MAG TPA: glycosyltransferase family protein [Anaerolineaceae bacterium]|nr:glycosyltransferase family protein [Anaerolineaceae bacterium]
MTEQPLNRAGLHVGNVVAIIQARMSSSRLPGKVLRDIGGQSMLERMITRVQRSQRINRIVIATTIDPSDAPIAELCQSKGWPFFRGNLYDVLDRYYQAALEFKASTIVRLTADCPLIDPTIIDLTLEQFFQAGVDFAANRLPPPWHRTYPIGMDTEVCSFGALERAWREAQAPYEREHVLPYLYDEPGRFRTLLVNTEPDYGHLRWTVDTTQDLEVIQRVYALFEGRDDFTYAELLELFTHHPELQKVNANVQHKIYTDHDPRGEATLQNDSDKGAS